MYVAKAIHSLVKAEQWPKAWHLTNQALNEDPENPELLYLGGAILRGLGYIGMSLPLFAKALSKDQKQPNLWMHYGATLHDLNEWDDAIEAFSVVSRMLPMDPMPYANIAASYTQQGKWRDAINMADKSLQFDPECYIAHISKSFACLALGRWSDGWKHAQYLYGRHLPVRVYNSPENEEPEWDGTKGTTVVVQADQGLGDILMYGQCLTPMMEDCTVILECAERLVPLMKRNFPGLIVYGTLKEQGQSWSLDHKIDAHIHISLLPKWYRKSEEEFPRKAYIKPDEEKVRKWLNWLEQFPKPWIGVSWKGGVQQTQKHIRSLNLEDLAPVLEKKGTFIDLSYKDNHDEVARWNIKMESQVICPPIDQDDYDDTVALVAALDEVVTVTTAIVHACASIGRTVKVLVPEVPMWRYAYRPKDGGMIWYPKDTVEMFRKVNGEEWSSTIKRLAQTL